MSNDICTELTRNELFYTACRVSFLRTFDGLLENYIAAPAIRTRLGFLEHIPLLSGTALQVQLDVLLRTWHDIHRRAAQPLTIEQQVVCLSCTHELAQAAIEDDEATIRRAARGPMPVDPGELVWLASRMRAMQIVMPFAPQAAVLQLESQIASDDLDQVRSAGGVGREHVSALLDLVGTWQIQSDLIRNSDGLLNDIEKEILRAFLAEHAQLVKPGILA